MEVLEKRPSNKEAKRLRSLGFKWCTRCKAVKSLDDFHKEPSRSTGYSQKCKPCKSIANRPYSRKAGREYRAKALKAYGGKCECCGEDRVEFLAVDHIDGGGAQHRRSIKRHGGTAFYKWLQNNGWPKGFRILCHNCNMSRGCYGFCPHEIEQ